jgi:RHS repeat-associated protein
VLREKGSERLYSLADPNWNVVAICNASGNIQERYTYDAFGKRNVFNTNFTEKAETEFNWNRAFTGQVLDSETELMLYRERYYNALLGKFISRDPIEYNVYYNLYTYVNNDVTIFVDVLGYRPVEIDITWDVRTKTELFRHHYKITIDYDSGCDENNKPFFILNSLTGNYLGFDQQLNDPNRPGYDEIDTLGGALGLVGITSNIIFESTYKDSHPDCPPGYIGTIEKKVYTFKVYREMLFGVILGAGPLTINTPYTYSRKQLLATKTYEILISCCKCDEVRPPYLRDYSK